MTASVVAGRIGASRESSRSEKVLDVRDVEDREMADFRCDVSFFAD